MRKRIYTRNVGILLTEDSYQRLIAITDKLEITLSGYLRCLVEKELRKNQKEEI
jgi:hypothetical protein